MRGGQEGLIERGDYCLLTFFPCKGEGGLLEGGGLIDDVRCSHGPSHSWTLKQAICEFQKLSLSQQGQVQNFSRENEF